MTAKQEPTFDPSEQKQHQDFYRKFRERIRRWLLGKGKHYRHAQILLVGPDLFHLMSRLVLDARVPLPHKVKLGAAIAYFVSPIDLMPEGLMGPVGYLDDIALCAYVLNGLVNAGHGTIAEEYWAGEGELLSVLQKVLETADEAIGAGLWQRVRSLVDRR